MPYRALAQILGCGASVEAGNDVEIRGADPVFRTPLPRRHRGRGVARRARARRGAIVAGARRARAIDLDRRRGRPRRRCAAPPTCASNGKPRREIWAPLSGFYPVRDGWIRFHCNFPLHRDAAYAVLGAAQERAAGEAASARLGGRGARGRDPRRGRLRRLRAQRRGLGAPPAGAGDRGAAADRDRADRRRAARAAARCAAPALGRAGARSDARARRPDLRQEPGRARRRRAQDQRRAPGRLWARSSSTPASASSRRGST